MSDAPFGNLENSSGAMPSEALGPALQRTLLVTVFVIATCGLIYELLASTVASYLLGDSVTQFSTVIGVYLFAMGLGSYLSKHVVDDLIDTFVRLEILVGIVGGLTSPVLFFAFAELAAFRVVLYSWVLLTGILVGLEIPLLLRILERDLPLSDLVSRVLSLDYLGALVASLIFPLWLVPQVGLMRSSLIFGVLNVAVATWAAHAFRHRLRSWRQLVITAWSALAILLLGAIFSERLMSLAEARLYDEPVIHALSTPYQRVVVTRTEQGISLYLNGHLQLSSSDEYRYHEALVHPAASATHEPRRALVLGGGDGMAVRELLRYPSIETITLVDLDPEMVALFRDHPEFAALNGRAFSSPRVEVIHDDAFVWIDQARELFDLVIVDFPDPHGFSLGKLYTRTFYRRLMARLSPRGVVAVQSTSPLVTREAFWCVVRTIESAGLHARPYHAAVPSFGEWGFTLAARTPPQTDASRLPRDLRFLSPGVLPSLFVLPPDMAPVDVDIQRLDDQVLVRYHGAG
ncbi:MAG: polyamine aminopropyltransferase [Acidobacteriota bacterium]